MNSIGTSAVHSLHEMKISKIHNNDEMESNDHVNNLALYILPIDIIIREWTYQLLMKISLQPARHVGPTTFEVVVGASATQQSRQYT